MTTFLARCDDRGGAGLRLAVKDCIDLAGMATTVGSPVLADLALPAPVDAACMAGARLAGARIVGKTNLHELCFGGSGVNPWFGTPVNPLDPRRIPGGSSSGSAVAVATGEADVGYGTDTAGSIRNPAAHCGVVGLKTTFGRVSLDGVWPLAPSLDTVGALGRDVAAAEAGMALLEPGFTRAEGSIPRIGRYHLAGADPRIDAAIDIALAATGVSVTPVELPGWESATRATVTVLLAEALAVDGWIYDGDPERVGPDVRARFDLARRLGPGAAAKALAHRARWRSELAALFEVVDVVALPTSLVFAPLIGEHGTMPNEAALAVNLAGIPAVALPVPAAGHHMPASVQLLGPDGSEDRLLAAAALIESAVAPWR